MEAVKWKHDSMPHMVIAKGKRKAYTIYVIESQTNRKLNSSFYFSTRV